MSSVVGIALQLRQDLHDDVVAGELREILRDLALAEGVVQRVVDQLRLDAVARGLVAVDRRASASCRRSAGRWRRRAAPAGLAACASIFGAQSFSSSRSASCSVYWYCVREARPPTLHVLRGLQEQRARPATLASFGRSRAMTWSALASRSSRGFSVMNMRPVLSGVAAAADGHRDAWRRQGPPARCAPSCLLLPHHLGEGDVLRALPTLPVIRPVSCCGKKPLGIIMNRQHR